LRRGGTSAGVRRRRLVTQAGGEAERVEAAQVSLLRWLRRQLRQPIPAREHLEAAVENDDVAEARRLLAGFEFSDDQRRNVEQLLDAWERQSASG
jgi:hypothetical protein